MYNLANMKHKACISFIVILQMRIEIFMKRNSVINLHLVTNIYYSSIKKCFVLAIK